MYLGCVAQTAMWTWSAATEPNLVLASTPNPTPRQKRCRVHARAVTFPAELFSTCGDSTCTVRWDPGMAPDLPTFLMSHAWPRPTS
ncbi:hypothetical protein B0H16DRAFT_1549657 [Mycena metata]|uniref:Uncharacterized protein n=1 Tax=Mycena metata TaxID=1033252 RepID=A0AAD7IW81_9AGAR|nr:hypothetical protein B0H16DRAFT_1549657 [Mycena metata]